MPIEIIVPRLGWSMEEGAFVAWLKKDGEFVHSGEALFSIEGDKAVQEIESIDSGILRIAVDCPKPGEPLRVGDVLGHLLSENEATAKSEPKKTPSAKAKPKATTPSPLLGRNDSDGVWECCGLKSLVE
jgi:pyruvate dehydrogenase E2 component (dihydrolipoamide acetyltransferase)